MDICTTATVRPEILDRTLRSFYHNLFSGTPCRLVLNIDPIGDTSAHTTEEVIEVGHKYFDNILVNCPEKPCFPYALKWTWEQAQGKFFFNLEDDWELLAPMSLEDMVKAMNLDRNLASLRFPKGGATEIYCTQSRSPKEPKYKYNGLYYECPPDRRDKEGYFGSPSLIRTSWAKRLTKTIDNSRSPEKQLRALKKAGDKRVSNWKYGVWSRPGINRLIVDIGTSWRRSRRIRKNSYTNFTEWSSDEGRD